MAKKFSELREEMIKADVAELKEAFGDMAILPSMSAPDEMKNLYRRTDGALLSLRRIIMQDYEDYEEFEESLYGGALKTLIGRAEELIEDIFDGDFVGLDFSSDGTFIEGLIEHKDPVVRVMATVLVNKTRGLFDLINSYANNDQNRMASGG